MKYVKCFITLLVLLSFVFSLASCANVTDNPAANSQTSDKKPPKVVTEKNFIPELYQSSEYMTSYFADRVDPLKYERTSYPVSGAELITRTLFGRDYVMHLFVSFDLDYEYSYDCYSGALDSDRYRSCTIRYKRDSGELLYFQDGKYNVDSYQMRFKIGKPTENSPAKRFKDQTELVSYAASVMKETSGISVEGWDVKVYTGLTYEDNDHGIQRTEGYVNDIDKNPDFNAEYTITFNETICGVKRMNYALLQINAEGEITEYSSPIYDQLYRPFAECGIDKESIDSHFNDSRAEEKKYTAFIYNETELWVKADISYRVYAGPDEDDYYCAGYRSLMKLAALVYE